MLSLYSLKESPYRSVLFAERRPIRALLVQMQVTLEMRLRPWVYCEWEEVQAHRLRKQSVGTEWIAVRDMRD